MDRKYLRIIYLYEFKEDGNASRAARNINERFGKNTVSVRTVEMWFKKFRKGNYSLKDKDGRGRKSVLKDDDLRKLVESDNRQSMLQLSKKLKVGIATIDRSLKRIGKAKKMNRWVDI